MRIGIDCRKIYDVNTNSGAGVERYTYFFVRKLLERDQKNSYVLFFQGDISSDTLNKIRGRNDRVKIVKNFSGQSTIPVIGSHLKFGNLLRKEKLDITIFPSGSMPLFYKGNSFVIAHDAAIYINSSWFPDKQWFSTKIVVPRSYRKARKIICVSHNTKNDLKKLFKIPDQKIITIYPGVVVKDMYSEEEFLRMKKKYDVKGEYVLFVGTIEPRKNVTNLIKAFSTYLFENEYSNITFVLAGAKGWKYKNTFKSLEDVTNRLQNSQIKYIGRVSNRERNILLKNAKAFVFPSFYEGFGFPVIEAMALGTPVLTSNTSSLGEIAKDCAILVNPEDFIGIKKGIKQLVEDYSIAKKLSSLGRERASFFTWDRTIDEFFKLI
jgi:glycosyltransferase involved in cell wall biosynthesis